MTETSFYKIIVGYSLLDFNEKVNKALKEGYMLQGGVSIAVYSDGDIVYAQAVIRENNKQEK